MVSTMSSISFCSAPPMSVTRSVGRRRTSLPYLTIGRTATRFSLPPLLHRLDHRLDGVLRALLVEIVQHLADAGIARQRCVDLRFVETKHLRRLRASDGRGSGF